MLDSAIIFDSTQVGWPLSIGAWGMWSLGSSITSAISDGLHALLIASGVRPDIPSCVAQHIFCVIPVSAPL